MAPEGDPEKVDIVWVKDPDFGWMAHPREGPTQEEWDETLRRLRTRPWRRGWPDGSRTKCARCGADAFIGQSGLTEYAEHENRVYVFTNLRGGKCEACGLQRIEGEDIVKIEDALGAPFRKTRGDYEAKVSRLGSGSLGTYWPRDIQRLFGLKPQMKARIQIVDQRSVLVRFD